jgi:transcriptional regulator with PAS, ATPase and Fis domain
MGKQIESIPKETMDALSHYAWPGNIRELQNLIAFVNLIWPHFDHDIWPHPKADKLPSLYMVWKGGLEL